MASKARKRKLARRARNRRIKQTVQKSLIRAIRDSRKMGRWRRRVMALHPECMWCGTTENLDVDHATPLAELLKQHRIFTLKQALACAALWDPDNGARLCWECHYQKTLEDADLYGWDRSRVHALFAGRRPLGYFLSYG